jgi:hypothetical protein
MDKPLTVTTNGRAVFWRRMLIHSAITLAILGISLLVGHLGLLVLRALAVARRFSECGDAPRWHGPRENRFIAAGESVCRALGVIRRTGGDCHSRPSLGSRSSSFDAPCALG